MIGSPAMCRDHVRLLGCVAKGPPQHNKEAHEKPMSQPGSSEFTSSLAAIQKPKELIELNGTIAVGICTVKDLLQFRFGEVGITLLQKNRHLVKVERARAVFADLTICIQIIKLCAHILDPMRIEWM